jgi:hypothetical protein
VQQQMEILKTDCIDNIEVVDLLDYLIKSSSLLKVSGAIIQGYISKLSYNRSLDII